MAAEPADTLDPDYWTGLGNIATQGKELILSYEAEGTQHPDFEESRCALQGEDYENPFDFLVREMERPVEFQMIDYLERQHDEEYRADMRVKDVVELLSDTGSPQENLLGMNGMRTEVDSLVTRMRSISAYIEYTLGQTDTQGVKMNGMGETARTSITEQAEEVEDTFYQLATKI